MSEFGSVNDALARVKKIENVKTEVDLAQKLGMTRQKLYKHRSRNDMPAKEFIEYAMTRGISLDWIIRGVGEPRMDRRQENLNNPMRSSKDMESLLRKIKELEGSNADRSKLVASLEKTIRSQEMTIDLQSSKIDDLEEKLQQTNA